MQCGYTKNLDFKRKSFSKGKSMAKGETQAFDLQKWGFQNEACNSDLELYPYHSYLGIYFCYFEGISFNSAKPLEGRHFFFLR